MERDFMGLNSRKDSVVVVKEEAIDGFKDSSGAPWMLSGKVSAVPPFKPFKSLQGEKIAKLVSDHHAALGFMKCQPAENFFGGAASKQQFVGGAPVAAPSSNGFLAGTTEPWFSAKASSSAPQLTIFYGGSVNIFEDITPEKAQAIMFLAGSSCLAQARSPVQSPPSKFAAGDAAFRNQTTNVQPSSALSSPISVSSHPVSPSGDDVKTSKTAGVLTKVEARMVSLRSVAASGMMPSAVPQARKASLARFLEKRKERAMNSSPYNFTKKSECGTPDSYVGGFPATSVAGSSS